MRTYNKQIIQQVITKLAFKERDIRQFVISEFDFQAFGPEQLTKTSGVMV